MPDAGVVATILLIAGLFLLALELMIPSFGLLGISATVCLAASLWAAVQAWWHTQPGFFWTYLLAWVGGIPAVLLVAVWLIQNTRLGNHVVLQPPDTQDDQAPLADVRKHLKELIGRKGETLSPLTPGGLVTVSGERHHAECRGGALEAGAAIRVVDVQGTRLVVQACPDAASRQQTSDSAKHPQSGPASDQLDFDIPENYTVDEQTDRSSS